MSFANKSGEIQFLVGPQWEDLNQEDKVVLKNISERVNAESYSLRKKPTKITITFYGIDKISYEDLKMINLCSGDICNVELNLKKKTLRITKWKHLNKPKEKEVKIQSFSNQAVLSTLSERWLKKEEDIREEDKRLLKAVVETVVRWTWDRAACKTTLKNSGDQYTFEITNLSIITFSQCQELMKLNNVVLDLQFYMGDKKISFKIKRSIYSNNKKRKRNE